MSATIRRIGTIGFGLATITIASFSAAQRSAPAQASLLGKVIRDVGVAVADVEVKLSRMKGGKVDKEFEEQTVKTDAGGAFAFKALQPGDYMLTVSAKFVSEDDLPCRPSGLLARNKNQWLVAVARTKDGGIVEVVTSDALPVAGGKARTETVDLRCH